MSERTWKALLIILIPLLLSSCDNRPGVTNRVNFTKEGAAQPLSYWTSTAIQDRLVLIQKSLNDIEERLTRIEEKLDK